VVRSTVIVDPAGTIRHHWPEVIPEGHAERVRRKLIELQAQTQSSDPG
jgi:peroxiredoxin